MKTPGPQTAKTPKSYSAVDPEAHVGAIAAFIPADARLIRVDGHSGVGKSRIAKALASFLSAKRIDVDSFADPAVPGRAYLPKIILPALVTATEKAMQSGRVVLDGLWLDKLLPLEQFGEGFRICVISQTTGESDGYRDEIRRRRQFETDRYFEEYKPDETADLLLIVPHAALFGE